MSREEQHFDALIVGSGASGGIAACELTAQGLRVLMLEAGRAVQAADFDPALRQGPRREINIAERAHATVTGQKVQARAAFYRRAMRHFFVSDRRNPYSTPADAPYLWIRGHQEGGRMHSFGRVLMRWSDLDFRSGSTSRLGADWPIDLAELAPYYAEVEQSLGLRGNPDGLGVIPDSVYAGPASMSKAEHLLRDRLEAGSSAQRVINWRTILPDPSRRYAPLRQALATGLLTIRHSSVARRILTDRATGRATGAEMLNLTDGAAEVVRAGVVVLAASPVETVRLMLNSASERHPHGIGNDHDQLGRYFMDQLPVLAQGKFPETLGWESGLLASDDPFYPGSGGIWIVEDPQKPERKAKHPRFAYQGSIGRMPTPDAASPSRWAFFGFGEMEARAENRITLNTSRKDVWGMPIPHIRCGLSDQDRAALSAGAQELSRSLTQGGAEIEFVGTPLGLEERGRGAYPEAPWLDRFLFRKFFRRTFAPGAAIHESGGARMGHTPEVSVLNPFGQCWSAPNLVVADASAFASSGITGTTLTVMALALRNCRNLAQEYRASLA